MTTTSDPGVMTRRRTFLFAVTAGVAVANLYLAQPLLDFIARDLKSSTSTAGWLVTATQIGYAVGVFLIVPLGDVVDRRRLISTMLLCAAVALLACAAAPSFGILLIVIIGLGITTCAGQILAPLAGDLSSDTERGRVVGTVVSGILTGILVSRTVSGLIAGAFGWRTVFLVAAVADVLFAVLLYRGIPTLEPKTAMPYKELLASVVRAVKRERVVRWTLVIGATGFGIFSMFWTALTFLLSSSPFNYSVSVIGLFGLAGVAGATTAQRAGRFHDSGKSLPAQGCALALLICSFVISLFASHSVVLVLVTIVLLDIAIQATNILNQTRMFSVSHEARSRLNTAFVVSNFIGGAIGSALASVLWSLDGWTAISIAGIALGCFSLTVWAVGRRGPLLQPQAG